MDAPGFPGAILVPNPKKGNEMSIDNFKGDVSPQQAWQALSGPGEAVLLDVRTTAEWAFVGGPDLSSVGKTVVQVAWQEFPGMARNDSFVEDVLATGVRRDQPIYIICRSGVRSRAAGIALAEQGYTTYNIADGFEGQLGANGHRGVGGWRALDLPWKQG